LTKYSARTISPQGTKLVKTAECPAADAKISEEEEDSSSLGRKNKARPIPKRVEDCDALDLMLWQWRRSGETWEDIKNEYVRLAAVVPGRSSLSVRFSKMEENFIKSGAAHVRFITATSYRENC
jgi:hypothetical protein